MQKEERPVIQMTDWWTDNIRLTHTHTSFDHLQPFSASADNEVVRLHFGLQGNYAFNYKQLGQHYDLIGGHHNLMYSKGFDIEIIPKSKVIETFGIQFPVAQFIAYTQNGSEQLQRFADAILAGKSVMLADRWSGLTIRIQEVINDIRSCRYEDPLRKLFLLSKSLELLVLSASAYESQVANPFIKTSADKEKIIAVRDLINSRLTDPPGLTEIARIVQLNEYKLKRGFKEIFQTTIFDYLTGQRLQLANRYLQDTSKTSAEIAYELGYTSPQHFNNAFKKRFGVTPNSVRLNP
jgi:AraC-like DNA-binding protein